MKKIIYNYKIKDSAYNTMRQDLHYIDNALAIKDGEICRIVDIVNSNHFLLKSGDSIKTPKLYQIELLNNKDHHALIYPDLIELLPVEEYIIFTK
ncbi:MAG: hypothetical protein MH137_06135 [Flavobacteriales bacterium]|nr:hypothetical protein [Flavobacteriales bacterium]